ncbi:MAG: S8 family serine peptidase [Thermoproteota archaeon]
MKFVKKKENLSSKKHNAFSTTGLGEPKNGKPSISLISAVLTVQLILMILQSFYLIKLLIPTSSSKIDPLIYEELNKNKSATVFVTASYRSSLSGEKTWLFRNYKIVRLTVYSREQLNKLENDPLILSVWSDYTLTPPPFFPVMTTSSSTYNIESDPTREYHKALGKWTGKGVTVAIIDTGIDYTHPDFCDENNLTIVKALVSIKIRTQQNNPILWIPYVNGSMESLKIFDDFCLERVGETAFMDLNGHGTHISGIIAGQGRVNNKFIGIAPKAKLVVVKAFDKDGQASLEIALDALHYVFNHVADFNISIVNLSWGAPLSKDGNDPISIAASEISDIGVFVVAAGGNYQNFPSTISSPAISPKVICIGAWDAYQNKIPSFSSLGRFSFLIESEEKIKPDFLASGVMVVAPLSKYANYPRNLVVEEKYVALSGTSMSTAVASGVIAEWIEYYKTVYRKNPDKNRLLTIIKENALRLSWLKKDFISGYGIIMSP